MNTLKNFKVTFTENFVRFNADSDGPLGHMWFVSYHEEFAKFSNGEIDHMTDISHNITSYYGGLCIFYDMIIPGKIFGTMETKFHRVNFPFRLRKMIVRLLQRVIASGRNLKENPYEFEISQKKLDRIIRMYGPGTGNVEVEVPEYIREKYENYLGTDNFDDRLEYLKTCAKNSTTSWLQTAKVKLSNDGCGFCFSIPGTYGGLIRHENDGKVEWSIHT